MKNKGFTPLHPKNPSFATVNEQDAKLWSTEIPRPLGRGVTGFTLIEIMVSIIIVAILAAIGLVNYMGQLEKSRSAEAQANLGMLKTLARSYYQETGNYPVLSDLMDASNILPSAGSVNCTNSNYYFDYKCDGDQNSPTCTATRCTSGGKAPNHTDWGSASYYYSINWLTGAIHCEDNGVGRCPK